MLQHSSNRTGRTRRSTKLKNIIFLDIDGVIRPALTVSQACLDQADNAFSPISVGLLNRLCKLTNAQLVITSTWRRNGKGPIIEQIERALNALNCLLSPEETTIKNHCQLFCQEPDAEQSWRIPLGNRLKRSEHIDIWLDRWGDWVQSYCILDDIPSLITPKHNARFISIEDADIGFNGTHYTLARSLLSAFS